MSTIARPAQRTKAQATRIAPSIPRAPDPAAPATSLARFGLPNYETAPDDVLLARLARADIVALGVLYSRHAVRLYTAFAALNLEPAIADARLCELFLAIWRQQASGRGSAHPPAATLDDTAVEILVGPTVGPSPVERISEARVRQALRTAQGQEGIRPPVTVRRRLMTRLGHPHVEAEVRPTDRAVLGMGFLAFVAAAGMTVLTGWWLLW